jgi:hypothetical protein
MDITPPYGYDEIVPLQKTHRVLVPAEGATPVFCRSLNAMAVSYSEFTVAGRDYPLVFASVDGEKSFAPVVVLGLRDGQNLYVAANGDWDRTTYVPAFVRRYPFCISKLYVDGEPQGDKVVCIAKEYLDNGGIALYDAQGHPTTEWAKRERLLQDYEADLDLTAQMCAIFAKLDLFAPFTMQVVQNNAPALELKGMFRIDEKKFTDLKPTNHKALVAKGMMGKIFAHLHSLENFGRLYQRAVAVAAAEAPKKSRGVGAVA